MSSLRQIRQFARNALVGVPPATRFKVKHMTAEGAPQLLDTIKFKGDNVDQIADQVSKQAVESSVAVTESFGGMPQRFVLVALAKEGDGPLRALGSYPWMEKPKQSSLLPRGGLASEMSEPATSAGHLAQLMRHNEATTRILADAMGSMMATLQETNETQRRQIETESANRLKVIQLVEELHSDKMARELMFDKHTRDEERKDSMMKKLMEIGFPVVAHHMGQFFGAKIGAMTGTGATEKLRQLAGTLTAEQAMELQKLLTPDQVLLLTEALSGEDEEDAKKPAESPSAS